MHRHIEVTCDEPSLQFAVESVRKCLVRIESHVGFSIANGPLGVAFLNTESCSQLHLRFFNDPDPTDVMTFPGDAEDDHAGDIAICPSIAAERCLLEGTTFQEELTLYLVHAYLHLAGLDDRDSISVREMRAAEKQLMQHLRDQSDLIVAKWTGQ